MTGQRRQTALASSILQQRRTGVADGEEELGVFLAANGVVTPVHGCYLSLVLHARCL